MTHTVVHGLPRWSLAVPPLALIVTLMASGGAKAATLARDTVFAAVMIICNGIVGLSLVVGSLRHRIQNFRVHASYSVLAVMTALVTLSLVVPTFTTSTPGPTFSGAQLVFAGVVSLVMYGVFVFVQTIRHRDYFLPVLADSEEDDEDIHAAAPSGKIALLSLLLLFLCLVSVVGLAKTVSPKLESAVEAAGAPLGVVGVIIALLVLLPETVAAVRAAIRNRLQTSLNLALGSALASIGLTIPAIAVASIWLSGPLVPLTAGPQRLALRRRSAISVWPASVASSTGP